MKLQVLRFNSKSDSTNGLLFDITNEIKFLCYTLEDERREEKVMSETRIPAGVYNIRLRTVGGTHTRYSKNMVVCTRECYGYKTYLISNGY